MAVKNGAYSLDEKRQAVAYFTNNEVPKQIEQLLNKMFKEKPSDIFGYMAEYFGNHSKTPSICKVSASEILGSRGFPSFEVNFHCTVNGLSKHVASIVSPVDSSPPPESPPAKVKTPDLKLKTPDQLRQQKGADATVDSNAGESDGVAKRLDIDEVIQRIDTTIAPLIMGFDSTNQKAADETLQKLEEQEKVKNEEDLDNQIEKGVDTDISEDSQGDKPDETKPKSGQPMPKATLDEFFQFLSCQLQIQSREHCDELPVKDKAAAALFPQVDMHVKPNLGNTERWVPYHTVLGVHELFLMEAVHSRKDWTEKQKFFAIFVFRAHCKRDLFTQAQLPLMLSKTFWKDPRKAFEAEGTMEFAIRAYRAKTKKPLLTNCFRIIPERILKDDDQNLVRSIVNRSARLMGLAEKSFEVVKNKKLSPKQKLSQISEMIQNTEGCGNTWAKMLTVCIDLAYPQEKILDADCDVGVGAAPPLQCLLEKSSAPDRAALRELLKKVNTSHSASAKHFWTYLAEVEAAMGKKFKHLPLVVKQAQTKVHAMSAATLQVQLCEYRQFRHSWARNVYGLPDDETMRMEDTGGKARPEDLLSRNKTQVLGELEHEGKQVKLSVTIKDFGSAKVAERVAMLMLQKLRSGTKEKDLVKRLDLERESGCRGGVDVKEDSEAWKVCKAQMSHSNPLVSFEFKRKDGSKFPFQTTVKAAGHILVAERIARLCWEKLNAGKSKDEVLKFRDGLYASQSSTAKKRKRE